MALDREHAAHLKEEVDYTRGLLAALSALNKQAEGKTVPFKAHASLMVALSRSLECLDALIEGYEETPELPP